MHIVQLANFHGPTSGGIKVALRELGRRYVMAGHTCTRIVPGEHDERSVVDGVTEISVGSPLIPGLGGYRVIVRSGVIDRLLAHEQPDAIELSDKSTMVGGAARRRRSGARVVLISHERLDAVLGDVTHLGGAIRPLVQRYNRRLQRSVDAVVGASQFAIDEFDPIQGTASICRVPLGVDLERFTPTKTPRGDGPLRVITVVRQSPEKSPHLVVDAAHELAERGVDFDWAVYGDGPLRRRLARRAPTGLHFEGHLADRSLLAAAMQRADVGVAPGPNETFGLAALELLASGTPVVVPDRGALREVVTDRTGHVAAPNGAAIADGIEALATSVNAETASFARHRAAEFAWETTASSMLVLLGAASDAGAPASTVSRRRLVGSGSRHPGS